LLVTRLEVKLDSLLKSFGHLESSQFWSSCCLLLAVIDTATARRSSEGDNMITTLFLSRCKQQNASEFGCYYSRQSLDRRRVGDVAASDASCHHTNADHKNNTNSTVLTRFSDFQRSRIKSFTHYELYNALVGPPTVVDKHRVDAMV
jgi:hypothetical protein